MVTKLFVSRVTILALFSLVQKMSPFKKGVVGMRSNQRCPDLLAVIGVYEVILTAVDGLRRGGSRGAGMPRRVQRGEGGGRKLSARKAVRDNSKRGLRSMRPKGVKTK